MTILAGSENGFSGKSCRPHSGIRNAFYADEFLDTGRCRLTTKPPLLNMVKVKR